MEKGRKNKCHITIAAAVDLNFFFFSSFLFILLFPIFTWPSSIIYERNSLRTRNQRETQKTRTVHGKSKAHSSLTERARVCVCVPRNQIECTCSVRLRNNAPITTDDNRRRISVSAYSVITKNFSQFSFWIFMRKFVVRICHKQFLLLNNSFGTEEMFDFLLHWNYTRVNSWSENIFGAVKSGVRRWCQVKTNCDGR